MKIRKLTADEIECIGVALVILAFMLAGYIEGLPA